MRELYHECRFIFEARLQRAKMSGQKIMVETEAGQAEASQFRSPKMVAVAPPEWCATSRQVQSCSDDWLCQAGKGRRRFAGATGRSDAPASRGCGPIGMIAGNGVASKANVCL
ncbi:MULTISPECIES: hypothetical protein [unclassified Mesorhizobium]|uniref:hypothetical protein n=1 Tax=unclassified Mesorhizobium TaxID=325217 RepID=UPI0019D4C0D6|nr:MULTISPECIES: hypothetical protein [unclassified Mesorhizobium]